MRKPVNMRFDPDLLARARLQAVRENRTLTNFIETVVRQRVAEARPDTGSSDVPARGLPPTAPAGADQDP
jgi:hypothetical protein